MRNKYATISDVDHQAYLSGQSAPMIANVMGAKRTTIDSIINKFVKEGRVEAKQRGGNKASKLTDDQKTTIRSWEQRMIRVNLSISSRRNLKDQLHSLQPCLNLQPRVRITIRTTSPLPYS